MAICQVLAHIRTESEWLRRPTTAFTTSAAYTIWRGNVQQRRPRRSDFSTHAIFSRSWVFNDMKYCGQLVGGPCCRRQLATLQSSPGIGDARRHHQTGVSTAVVFHAAVVIVYVVRHCTPPIKDSAPAVRGSRQPSHSLSNQMLESKQGDSDTVYSQSVFYSRAVNPFPFPFPFRTYS